MMGLWQPESIDCRSKTAVQNQKSADADAIRGVPRDVADFAAHSAMTRGQPQCDTRSTNTMSDSPRGPSETPCMGDLPQENPRLTYERPLRREVTERPRPSPRSLSKHAARASTPPQVWDNRHVYAASLPEQSTQLAETDRPNIVTNSVLIRVKAGIDPDMKILNLPYSIAQPLEQELDRGDWKKLVMVNESTRFSLNYSQINRLESCRGTESSSHMLLMKYGVLGMTVQQLVEVLDRARLESAMELLRRPEHLKITKQPKASVDLEEGETLTLTCEAVGFPRPRYQWFSYRDGAMRKLPEHTAATLRLRNIRKAQAGHFACQVHNSTRLNFPQSEWTTVTVKPSTKPVPAPRRLSRALCIVRQTQFAQLTVYQGQCLQLECMAQGQPPPRYQWYKDTSPLPGQDQPLLNLLVLNTSFSGSYVCMVMNGTTLQSNSIYVNVVVAGAGIPPPGPVPQGVNFDLGQLPQHTAQAKVALLMGTEQYVVAHERLPAARNDVLLLEKHLRQMDFMVITLLDLKKDELIQHVQWFCDLLDEGVYGLFFYIGHGFDHSHQSFLIPWDAQVKYSTKDCVHLQKDILCPILKREPAMCLAIIDICRVKSPQLSKDDQPEDVTLPANGSTCIFYTTSPGQMSYEHRDTEQGIFMTHLSKVIGEKISVQQLHSRVLAEIKQDPEAGLCQYPMIESNLNSTFSLHDPIDYKGHTQVMNRRRLLWETAQHLPRERKLTIPHAGFSVSLTFEKLVSNAMTMAVDVVQQGSVASCSFKVNDVPPQITGFQNFDQKSGKFCTTFVELQRLEGPLRPRLTMELEVGGEVLCFDKELDLGEPLVSSLHLYARSCGNRGQGNMPGSSERDSQQDTFC